MRLARRAIASLASTGMAALSTAASAAEVDSPEFWTWFGHSLKITDTLLVAFTFLLFLATLALWWSTRRLVQGADRNAERQLRAYVFVVPLSTYFLYDGENCQVTITFAMKNTGQTPAYQLTTFSEIRNLMVPTAEKLETPSALGNEAAVSIGPGGQIESTVWGVMDTEALQALSTRLRTY